MMQQALVIGASGGIGAAVALALEGQGYAVTRLSRSADGLDLTDEASVQSRLERLDGHFTTVFVATGALELGPYRPEKSLRAVDPAAFAAQFALNATGPLLVLKHALRLMPRDVPVRFAALSARVGSISDNHLGGWYGYRAAKAALNQLIHTAAIEVARSHPQSVVVSLHPGTVDTDLTRAHRGTHPAMPPAEAAAHLLAVLEGLTPAQTGGFYDWQGKSVPW
jgi:NAD(P)-dependent dehydrogenase (short-subunit alcohol dehydrogenase family)